MTVITAEINYPTLVEKFAKFLCAELDISPTRVAIVPYEVNDGTLGLCLDIQEDEFIIFVKEEGQNIGQICNTIAHEMVHVKQFLKENLNHWIHISSNIPYLDRWYEKEAFLKSIPLVEKFAETLRK